MNKKTFLIVAGLFLVIAVGCSTLAGLWEDNKDKVVEEIDDLLGVEAPVDTSTAIIDSSN